MGGWMHRWRLMQPIALPANLPDTFYRGAGRIAHFRRLASPPGASPPEDWIASTTRRFGVDTDSGLTTLPDGRLLADAIAAAPERWLGPAHVDRYGADPAILVKLLDAGERLPVHVHPDRRFATAHLASPYGKTEAWGILEAAPDAGGYLGVSRPVSVAELTGWGLERRDRGSLLFPSAADEFFRAERVGSVLDPGFSVVVVTSGQGALGTLPVAAGDTLVVPYAAGAVRVSGDLSAIRLRPPAVPAAAS